MRGKIEKIFKDKNWTVAREIKRSLSYSNILEVNVLVWRTGHGFDRGKNQGWIVVLDRLHPKYNGTITLHAEDPKMAKEMVDLLKKYHPVVAKEYKHYKVGGRK